ANTTSWNIRGSGSMSQLAYAGNEAAIFEKAGVEKRQHTNTAIAVAIFATVLIGLVLLDGNRLVFSTDEGIILDAADRMVRGQTLYRDFFGYMSPGSYWLQEAVFRVLGTTQLAGRVVVLFDFAVQCAVLFWLVAAFAERKAALITTTLFFAYQVPAS